MDKIKKHDNLNKTVINLKKTYQRYEDFEKMDETSGADKGAVPDGNNHGDSELELLAQSLMKSQKKVSK